jgi:hypothetical protein
MLKQFIPDYRLESSFGNVSYFILACQILRETKFL